MMAVTTTQIRDLLNRPRGLNEATITEYLTIRNAEITKKARKVDYVGGTADNVPSDTLKDSAIKFMVCVDCLRVLLDSVPAIVDDEIQQRQMNQVYTKQLSSMEKAALEAIRAIEEKGGSAFKVKATSTRVGGTTTSQLSGSLHPSN